MKNAPPPIVNLLPENAPFTPEQRNWLNGFFAGLVSLEAARRGRSRSRKPPLSYRRCRLQHAMTAQRPGTIRACRSTSA
jgi:hypothetical protein